MPRDRFSVLRGSFSVPLAVKAQAQTQTLVRYTVALAVIMFVSYTKSSRLLSHPSTVTAAAFSLNAAYLTTASADGGIFIWNVAENNLICSASGDTAASCIHWRACGNTFVYGTESGNVASCTVSPVRP